MANRYLMAVDAGTGSVRAVLFSLRLLSGAWQKHKIV